MKKTIVLALAALFFSAPALAQEVSVGSTTSGSSFVNVQDAWQLENKVEAVGEVRLSSRNVDTVKVGLQREFVVVGPVTLSGRLNLVQGFGKTNWTGYSVEPTASFNYEKAKVTVGYEMADSFASRHKENVDTARVTVMYPFELGNFGVRYEEGRGERRSTSLALVYSLKN